MHFHELHKLQVKQTKLFLMYAAINYELYMLIIQPSNQRSKCKRRNNKPKTDVWGSFRYRPGLSAPPYILTCCLTTSNTRLMYDLLIVCFSFSDTFMVPSCILYTSGVASSSGQYNTHLFCTRKSQTRD